MSTRRRVVLAASVCLLAVPAARAADLTIQSTRTPGFSDTTPATPLGLNPGTTRGDQALIVFQTTAAMWGATVRSTVPIVIDSEFDSVTNNSAFTCSTRGTVLAYTSPDGFFSSPNFPNPSAAYNVPLANALAGSNVGSSGAQFSVNINGDLGTSKCDFPASWYFGLDTQIPDTSISLLTTLLHEFGHGLGYSSQVDPATGLAEGPPTIFDFHIWDVVDDIPWTSLNPAARKNLVLTPESLSFVGPAVQADIPTFLAAPPTLLATFGGLPTSLNFAQGQFSGPLVGSGPLVAAVPLDGCSDLTNDVQGAFALIERSRADAGVVCTFLSKAERAVDAGAIGVVIYDDVDEALGGMGGTPALNVPATLISHSDGTTLQNELSPGPVTISFGTASQISNTGPGPDGGVLLYTPPQLRLGSSLIHWNSNSYPQTLMLEFANYPDIRLNMDFTPDVMSDLGWSVVTGLGVSVVKLLDPEVPAGAQFSYLIAVLNRRSTPIDNVTVNLALPSGTTFVSNVSSPAGCETAFPCNVGPMQPREVLLIVATVQASTTATSPFLVSATATPSSSDPNDNLTATSSQTVATGGDLQLTLTGPSTVTAGTTVTLTTKVTNAGPGDAAGVMVNSNLTGTAATLPSLTSNGGSCTSVFPCALGTLAAGQTVTIASTLTVPAGFQGGATFTTTASSTTPDSNAANNSATFTFGAGTTSGSSGCTSTGGPATLVGLVGLAMAFILRKRHTF